MIWDNYTSLSSDEFITYQLEINELNLAMEVINSIYPNATENQHFITGLKTNTQYELRVRVITKNYGSSILSDSLEFQTKVPETVMSLNVANNGHSSVDLEVDYDLADQTDEVANSAYILMYNLADDAVCTISYFLQKLRYLKFSHDGP